MLKTKDIKHRISAWVTGWIFFSHLFVIGCNSDHEVRKQTSLNSGWHTIACDTLYEEFNDFILDNFNDSGWIVTNVPHNWDDYGGYRRLRHGNRHGYAWYRKTFSIDKPGDEKQYFLFFEGVGSYATVWVNGTMVGKHAGGRTTFTLDITDAIRKDSDNVLAVRTDHPAGINDLPWVCGGCSPEWGFSEGSQPIGIFRPVHLVETGKVRIEPFGIHVWNNEKITGESADVFVNSEIKSYVDNETEIDLVTILQDDRGIVVERSQHTTKLFPGELKKIRTVFEDIRDPHLWSLDDPYMYTMVSEIFQDGKLLDRVETPFGIRWIHWDIEGSDPSNRFYLNGKPVFINGGAEYEHLMGQSHAFSNMQVDARISQYRAAGFNAFRDAHQPHNLRYQKAWDSLGILWWPQMAAHIWFDTPEFRENFKKLLADWVKERRNSPSIILWGLENESTLPEDFARECADLIRELDPTTSIQRKVTTCNGGTGTDWNVIQNWSGTYGGNPDLYGEELKKQLLNGEYGAWRTIDLHTEGTFVQQGPYSEDRYCLLMESKIRLAESVSDSCCGQFHWLFNSHDNPGRTQAGEGIRDMDRLGPVNYKGLFTIWGEPTDGYYLYRANYASKKSDPMVYIVSHTWPDRWISSGRKNGIRIFSNCDEVELFNGDQSLGRKKNPGRGSHFVWESAEINYNRLYARGFVNSKKVAEDCILLNHLPESPVIATKSKSTRHLSRGLPGRKYLYRVNCGGPGYTDSYGNLWMADVQRTGPEYWGSLSWTDKYDDLPPFYGSQRKTGDPIKGTLDMLLFQDFRYGRKDLKYQFPLPEGRYLVELFFIEPWYGTGGGLNCKGWRVFDVAINGEVVLHDLDIWNEAGHDQLLRKQIEVKTTGGLLEISFPGVSSGQAVISAIALSTKKGSVEPALPSPGLISELKISSTDDQNEWTIEKWMDTGDKQYSDDSSCFSFLPPNLYGAEWIRTPAEVNIPGNDPVGWIILERDADIYIGKSTIDSTVLSWPGSLFETGTVIESTYNGRSEYHVFYCRLNSGDTLILANPGMNKPMYTIALQEVSNLDAPIDLRSVSTYQAEDAVLFDGARQIDIGKKSGVWLSNENGKIGWEFSVGLASKYGLEFRYMNPSQQTISSNFMIVAADKTVVWEDSFEFLPTGNRWKSLRTDTRTTINAGKYTIVLRSEQGKELYFDWLKIQ